LVLFFFPIWHNLRKYAAVYRSLEGINAVVVGIMIASTFYLMKDISLLDVKLGSLINAIVIAGTFTLLQYTKIPPPFIVIIVCFLEQFFNFFAYKIFEFQFLLSQFPEQGIERFPDFILSLICDADICIIGAFKIIGPLVKAFLILYPSLL
jgi:chromate transport protein ChrA